MSKERYTVVCNAPRPLYIIAHDDQIVRIGCKPPPAIGVLRQDRCPVLALAAKELTAYFSGKQTPFTFPVPVDQPPFLRAVYDRIHTIPYGETRCLEDIVAALGGDVSKNAVCMACRFTLLPVRIPVHRVTGIYADDEADLFGDALRRMERRTVDKVSKSV